MRLDGLAHITTITADARRAAEFYCGTLGLRLISDSASPADPAVRQLSCGASAPGGSLVFLEYPSAIGGRPGAGMVHRIAWRVPSEASLTFWRARLGAAGAEVEPSSGGGLRFQDPEGLGHELVVDSSGDRPLPASVSAVPPANAILGLDGVRAYAPLDASAVHLMETVLGARRCSADQFELRGATRGGWIQFSPPPPLQPRRGAGTVHHVAWVAEARQQPRWLARLERAGIANTGIVEHAARRSLFFEGPDGLLLDLLSERRASASLGSAADGQLAPLDDHNAFVCECRTRSSGSTAKRSGASPRPDRALLAAAVPRAHVRASLNTFHGSCGHRPGRLAYKKATDRKGAYA
jgi:glyoxalase family protein